MKNITINVRILLAFAYGLLAVGLSCTDHDLPQTPNDPESACLKINMTPREYPCEFKIEKLTFYAKDNSVIGDVLPESPDIVLSRAKANVDSNPAASADGAVGTLTFDVKAVIKRIASPSFPVSAGYKLIYTNHSSGPGALTTPGESVVTGSPVPLSMPIGATTEVTFQVTCMYQLANTMMGVKPIVFRKVTAFLIYNDVTSQELDLHPSYIGDVAEAYIRINNTMSE